MPWPYALGGSIVTGVFAGLVLLFIGACLTWFAYAIYAFVTDGYTVDDIKCSLDGYVREEDLAVGVFVVACLCFIFVYIERAIEVYKWKKKNPKKADN
jgi:TRAP-type C4-dicarboxylate transport system permease small subunit